MQRRKINLKNNKFSKYKCSCCEELFGEDAIPKELACGHILCGTCIYSEWEESGRKRSVPCNKCSETHDIYHPADLSTCDGILEMTNRLREKIERAEKRDDSDVSSDNASDDDGDNGASDFENRLNVLNGRSKKRQKRREDNESKCPKCRRTYHYSDHHLPKELSCDHLLCSGCVKKQKSVNVTCYVCQEATHFFSLRTDFELLEFLEDSDGTSDKHQVPNFRNAMALKTAIDAIGETATDLANQMRQLSNLIGQIQVPVEISGPSKKRRKI